MNARTTPSVVVLCSLLGLLCGATLVQCDKRPASKTATDSLSCRWVDLPKETEEWICLSDVQEALRETHRLARAFPPVDRFDAFRGQWKLSSGFGIFDAAEWAERGFLPPHPVLVFGYRDHWVLHSGAVDRARLLAWLERVSLQKARLGFRHQAFETPLFWAVVGPSDVFLALPRTALKSGDDAWERIAQSLVDSWGVGSQTSASRNPHFGTQTPRDSARFPVFGTIHPSSWFAELPARSAQAELIRDRLMAQSSEFHFGIRSSPRGVQIELRSRPDRSAPAWVESMGRPSVKLPMLGGLIEPGILGVIRGSGSSLQLFELIRSTLGAEDRDALDRWLVQLHRDLRIDLKRDVVENLTGHVVVVLYGFRSSFFQPMQPTFLSDLLLLEGTREAMMWTIRDRDELVRVIDAWTALSRGKLQRQEVEGRIQYAWFADGALKWALLIDDATLIFVDGVAAFDHASAYQKTAEPLALPLESTLAPLLDEQISLAAYLDLRGLSDLLAETDNELAAMWLRPFSSVMVTSKTEASGEEVTEIVLERNGGGTAVVPEATDAATATPPSPGASAPTP